MRREKEMGVQNSRGGAKVRKALTGACAAALLVGAHGFWAEAAFEPQLEAAYNMAVQGQDTMEGLDVSVTEKTVSSATNAAAYRTVDLKVSGIQTDALKADVRVDSKETTSESYYANDYYYAETSDGKTKREMDRASIWQMINANTYLDLTSNYLKMLCSETNADGSISYRFAATPETLGDYAKKLLLGAGSEQGVEIDSLQGTMQVDADGHVTDRSIQLVYTVTQQEQQETFLMTSEVEFHQPGAAVEVALPDLSGYQAQAADQPAETLTPLTRTVYVSTDVNVRAAGDLGAAILGGLTAGTSVMETGYTSDGWVQVQYNGAAGYVWGDYVTTSRPVLTKDGSGTMYATAEVNVRSTYSSDGAIYGTLAKGTAVEITGTTDNGWVRVKYNGATAYVYADYLSWKAPMADTYVKNGYQSGTVVDASFGVLVIRRDDGGGEITFNTTYAQLNLKDTIETGDWVEVSYFGAGAPYTASTVNDYTRHVNAAEEQSVSAEGVVTALTPDMMQILDANGICREFDLSESEFEMADDLYEGKYVIVYWMSRTNGAETKDIPAFRVQGA